MRNKERAQEENYDGNNVTQDYRFYCRIQKAEVEFTLKKMRLCRAI